MEMILIIVFILVILLLFTKNDTDSKSIFRVSYSSKIFDADGNYWVQPKCSEDVVATSPEEAVKIIQESLRIRQERESTDLGFSNKEYSNFKITKL